MPQYFIPRMVIQWSMQRHRCVEPTNSEVLSQYWVSEGAGTETILLRHAEKHTQICKYMQGYFPDVNMHYLVLNFFILSAFSILHTWLLHSAHHYGLLVVTCLLNGRYFELSMILSVYFSTQQTMGFLLGIS